MNPEPSLARRTAQFALTGFLFLSFCSLSTTVAYTLGRLKGAQSADKPLEKQMVPLIIDPATQPLPVPRQTPVARSVPVPQPVVVPAAVPVPQPVPVQRPVPVAPAAAPYYFQVGSLEKGMAEASKQYLEKKAFQVKVTPSSAPSEYRVLVGPLEPGTEVNTTRAALESLGFRVFLRRL